MLKDDDINWYEYFYYDESSPTCLMWKNDKFAGKNGCIKTERANRPAGTCLQASGYYVVGVGQKNYLVHRVVWGNQ